MFLLASFRCSSHQSNLTVRPAVLGDSKSEEVRKGNLVANCVRLFRYIYAEYIDELSCNLTTYVCAHLQVKSVSDVSAQVLHEKQNKSRQLQLLYSAKALPDELLSALNGDITLFECFAEVSSHVNHNHKMHNHP